MSKVPIDYGICPRCNNPIIETNMSYKCSGSSNNPQCTYVVWKEDRYVKDKGIRISATNIKKLIEGKRVLVKGIKRKDGTGTYDAYMFLEDTGRYVNYKFDIVKKGMSDK